MSSNMAKTFFFLNGGPLSVCAFLLLLLLVV